MSQGSKQAAANPQCTCVVERISANCERIIRLCDVCAPEFSERHAASAGERAAARAQLVAEQLRARA